MFIGVIAERKSPKESRSMIWFVIMCHMALADIYSILHKRCSPTISRGNRELTETLAYDAVG